MAERPRVTVLMTVYNGMPYLAHAVHSVLRQTFTDLECLIIDDGSTDGSVPYLQGIRDPRIVLVRQPSNLGQAASLNRGLALARGAYVARLDQDDVCLPARLAAQVAYLDAHPAVALVGSWLYWMTASGRRTGLVGVRVDEFGTAIGILLTRSVPLGHPTAMFRRAVVQGLGGYDPSYAPAEDYELWCRLALARQGIAVIPRPLVQLRLHAGQQSAARGALQEAQLQRAHARLVAAFCPAEATALVAPLLRAAPGFWPMAPHRREVSAALQGVADTVATLRTALRLSAREEASVRGRICWWLRRSATCGILDRQWQSLLVYRWTWRGGPRMLRTAATWAFPLCLAAAAVSGGTLRRILVRAGLWANRQQYRLRLLLAW